MRIALAVLVLLAACELPLPYQHGDDDDHGRCSNPPPGEGCSCSSGTWSCNTCGFGEGRGAVSCTAPGDTCFISTWEHDCDCSCGDDGWWHCFEGTIGSRCPQGAPDAGVPYPDVPDATLPDAGPCSNVEAEAIGSHPGWFVLYGNLSGDEGLTTSTANQTLTFSFTGTTFGVTYERGPSMGRFTVAIDAQAPVTVDAYQANNFYFTTTQIASGLANTSHTVTLTALNGNCSLDVFPVTCQ